MAEATSIVIPAPGLVIDRSKWEVSIHGRRVALTKTEFLLLHFLAGRPGVATTRQQIIDAIKGPTYPATARSVDVQVVGLRRKLGELRRRIETVRRVGYRFQEQGTPPEDTAHSVGCASVAQAPAPASC
jgi:two-component system phosphate regulon response regulator PhoB